ncbi:MAG TPA: hypothetical protein VD997_05845 [Phycisphaerales bacterium]|nr:hypothetical protein [Phycisphaerales bacterium]
MPEHKGRIVVLGIMFFYPLAGVTYQFLHYLLGLRRLGYDVYYLEDTLADVYDPTVGDYTPDPSRNIAAVQRVFERFGLDGRWGYRTPQDVWVGMSKARMLDVCRRADAVLNVTGAHDLRDEHRGIPRRLYVESDPFATQVKVAKGDERTIAFLDPHTHFFSFGESVGTLHSSTPVTRYNWQPTSQPVYMDLWRTSSRGGDGYTTITTWHNKGDGIEWQGERYYWTKDREFRKFLDVPRRRPLRFEMAAGVDHSVRTLLRVNGWENVDAVPISSDIDRYRGYIQQSRAEFTVARDQYVRPRTGWFSDRSVCYLAAGRPVITQATGFERHMPTGRGLFAFSSMEDILVAIDAIESNYEAHSRAAAEVAESHFGSDAVLASLLARAGL